MKKQQHGSLKLHQYLYCYGFSRYVPLIVLVALVLLVPVDWMFPSGTKATSLGSLDASRIIPRVVRAIVLGALMIYVILTGLDPGKYGFKAGRVLAGFAACMFLSIIVFSTDLTSDMFIYSKTLLWTIGAIAFFRLSLSGFLTSNHIKLTASAIIILASFYTIRLCLSPETRIGVNADAYLLLWCIPLMMLKGPSVRSSVLVALASVAIIVTVKRGALLALIVSMLAYVLTFVKLFPHSWDLRKLVPLIFIVGIALLFVFPWQWDNISYRLKDLEDLSTMGSGRGTFYRITFSEWYNSDMRGLMFGLGFYTVPSTLWDNYSHEIYAHSDWLEILHDMGLLGIAVFIALHAAIISILRKAIGLRHALTPSLVMGYCVFAMVNVYSGCTIDNGNTILFSLLLGYSAARIEMDLSLTSRIIS